MKKKVKIIAFSLLFCFLFFVMCGCSRKIAPIQNIKKITTIEKDTIIKFDTIVSVRADSSLLLLYAECDSNNNLLLSELKTLRGNRAKIKFNSFDNYIYVNCLCDSLEIEIKKQKTINKYITEQYIERQKVLTEKDSFIKRLGLVCVGMLLMCIVLIVFTFKKK